ncbi:MAG: potassium channel family protein [Dehalococcoidia bacterium]|nr:MAG: potassium channel family protein [Dehalococcoidia bacterium]
MAKKFSGLYTQDSAKREALLLRIERLTEAPLLVLAFIMIPLLVGPILWSLSPGEELTYLMLDGFIWALFAIDLTIKVAVSPHRLSYLKKHWLEVLVVVVPFFRPLRLLRIFIFGSRAWVGVRRLVNVDFLLVYGMGLVIVAATVVATAEIGQNTSIYSFTDALWWAIVTITTVGYGDIVPLTAAGRAMAIVLMMGGIAFFSGTTANLASFLVRGHKSSEVELAKMNKELEILRTELTKLRGSLT